MTLQSEVNSLSNYNQMVAKVSLSVTELSPKVGFLQMCVTVNKLSIKMLPKDNLYRIRDKCARASYQESPIRGTD